jgi:hypothetical protein
MLLLLILPAWALGLLLVVGLCAAARRGDAARAGADTQPAPAPGPGQVIRSPRPPQPTLPFAGTPRPRERAGALDFAA